MLRPSDAKFISQFDGVDPTQVGEIISDALHHRVYAYGEGKVLKVPKKPFKFLFSEKLHLEEDLARLHEFFPGLAVETDVLTSEGAARAGATVPLQSGDCGGRRPPFPQAARYRTAADANPRCG